MKNNKSLVVTLWILSCLCFLRPISSWAQTCAEPITLRSGTCPIGATACSTKGSALTWAEMDDNLINLVNLCNVTTSSSDSFKTIDAPSGTDPVADSATDTLNITCTGLSCTGTSGTDTLALVVLDVALGTATTGNYVSSATASQGLTLTGTEGASLGLMDCAAGEILKRNAGDTGWECAADASGGGGAPTTAQYLTLATDATLTNERVLTPGFGMSAVDGGAGSTYTLGFWTSDTLAGNPAYSAEQTVFTLDGTGGGLLFEGTSADTSEGILIWPVATSDKTLTLPNETGTLCSTGSVCTGYAAGTGGVANTATALAANGGNCSAGNYPLGVDASGAVETCTADDDTPDSDSEVPNAITLNGGTISGSNTLSGTTKTANLWAEGGQFSLGLNPHVLGIAEGTSGTPITDPEPTVVFQRRAAGDSNSTAFQFTYEKYSGAGFNYPLMSFVRQTSNLANDTVAVSGSIYSDLYAGTVVTSVIATPTTTGGTLATGTYSYYISAIVGGVEIAGSAHVDAAVTGPTGKVTLSWTGVSGATDYRVYRYLPGSPNTSPVYQSVGSGTASFVDTGGAGTAGVGLSTTHWALWGRTEKTQASTRLAGAELDVFNSSGRDAGPRVDRVGSTLGLQIYSGGTADNSTGIEITGLTGARFHTGILMNAYAFRDYGIDFSLSDNTKPAIRLANNQSLVGRNAANSADVEILRLNTSDRAQFSTPVYLGDGSGNDYLESIEEASNPSCAAGDYRIWANSADTKWKKCQNGTITDLDTVSGGGASNSFETLNAPSGTDPVADSATDTLNLTCGGGITCTGTSGTDTLDITLTTDDDVPESGDYTNLTAGRSLTIGSGTIDADSELYERVKCMLVETPVSGDDLLFFRNERAATITGIDCLVIGGTSVALLVKECDANGGSCGNTEASITCATTNTTEASGIDDASVDAGDWMRVDPGTVTGSVTQLSVCVTLQLAD